MPRALASERIRHLPRFTAASATPREATLSEFQYDLSHPNPAFKKASELPLLERNPLKFWQMLSGGLLLLNLILLYLLGRP